MDGLTVRGRELRRRPEKERSATIIEHERERSRRIADLWESQIENPLMRGQLNMAHITLARALLYESRPVRDQEESASIWESVAVLRAAICRHMPRYADRSKLSACYFLVLDRASNLRVGGSSPSRRARILSALQAVFQAASTRWELLRAIV